MLPKLNIGPEVRKSHQNLSDMNEILEGSTKSVQQIMQVAENMVPNIVESDNNIVKAAAASASSKNLSKLLRK